MHEYGIGKLRRLFSFLGKHVHEYGIGKLRRLFSFLGGNGLSTVFQLLYLKYVITDFNRMSIKSQRFRSSLTFCEFSSCLSLSMFGLVK